MKKIILLTLLLLSSLILSQNTVTKSIEIPIAQIPEIYKGLKQSDYLKSRLQKTETALSSANNLISEQDKALELSRNIISSKDEVIGTIQEVHKQDKIAGNERENQLKSDINILQGDLQLLQIDYKNKQRKKFWNGIKIGGISVAVLGAAGLIWFNNR
ncbi:hypothetical protein [Chryseobacterium sp.]|uniref:hypothetical protein n=1 Tax=Chryseobacterium sp. TaxID=1871047 RepID=UPI00289672FD|nr:hypothetical protein [Chryseobacterium sp.]